MPSRPRGFINDWNPGAEKLERVGQVKDVLEEYDDHLPLTVRQIFYRLVGSVGYPKTENAYHVLTTTLSEARRAGAIPFDAIRDDGIRTYGPPLEFSSAKAMVDYVLDVEEDLAQNGRILRLTGQPTWVSLWCEAAGMAPQLARVASRYGVHVQASGGFDSLTAKHDAAERIAARSVPTVVLHVGDFDPSGVTMYKAAMEDVTAFATDMGGAVRFKRIAVTREQVARYDLPGAPPRRSSHDAAWRAGEDAVQAEALPPDVLNEEVKQAIRAELDLGVLERTMADEARMLQRFREGMER